MTLSLGRVLKLAQRKGAVEGLVIDRRQAPGSGHVVKRARLEAEERAREIISEAEAHAQAMLDEARRACAAVRLRAEEEGRANGAAAVAGRALALAAHEARAAERQLDRTIELAELICERLLGEALTLDPGLIVGVARQALAEARGARQVKIVAHPEDIRFLERALGTLGIERSILQFEADPTLTHGNLRLVTDIGVLDGALTPQIHRLATKLRETLAHER